MFVDEKYRMSLRSNCTFKLNNINTRTRCEICSNLTIKTPERRQWRCSGAFIVNFEHISYLVLVFLSIVNFEQVNTSWVFCHLQKCLLYDNIGGDLSNYHLHGWFFIDYFILIAFFYFTYSLHSPVVVSVSRKVKKAPVVLLCGRLVSNTATH